MLRRYTNWILCTLCLAVTACSSVPIPFAGREPTEAKPEVAIAPHERTPQGAPSRLVGIDMPPLNSGNQALFDRGVALMRDGKPDSAQVLFEELVADQPKLAGPWVNLGYIHLARGEQQQSMAAFENALVANPTNCDALNHMGVLARRNGRFGEAEQYYKRCLEVQPLYANARLNLAILYELYMGRWSEALTAYNDYQIMLAEPNSQVRGWVMDLERRVAAIATR